MSFSFKMSSIRISTKVTAGNNNKMVGIGEEAPDFELKDEEGRVHKLSSFRGRRVILSFFRYASCPVCLYNIDRLKQQEAMLERAGIVTLCIFRSTPKMVKRAIKGTNEDTHTLSDVKGSVYNKFQVKQLGAIAAIKRRFTQMPKILKEGGKYYPYLDMKMISEDKEGVDAAMKQLPADFLIDENGIIVDLLRSKKPNDYMVFKRIEAFIPEDKRCKCNNKYCISPTCRENYEQIRKDAESMLCSW
eukprot:CAMPEP_0201719076 /NCGR_PEP_ID=MMETSP0593-20130828/4393_1 /ASSEMBLY_ACC=CAM_ASM_000672 /TAXON_ID=267983 /ORGANISM="Skeletonema japonicum, Strain CCMP2506" /LENGTH=245 /DNA_ID=CAMNT_0048209467 /DNA_START=160 /DNA_END=897 /DNA_ORIENTATION=+